MTRRIAITVNALWDEEAGVWVAEAEGDLGLVTEARTVEELRARLPVIARDLLEGDADELDIRLVAEVRDLVAA